MKNKLVGVTKISPEEEAKPATSAVICSICLSESVEHPIVLPECGHTFCFGCLVQWQNYTQNSYLTTRNQRSSSPQGRCPNCRESIPVSIVDTAIEKAQLYAAAGRLTDMVYDHHLKSENETVTETVEGSMEFFTDERQEKFCRMALEQINQVLNADPTNIVALCTKGEIFRHVMPQEAIDAIQEVLRLDEEAVKTKEKLDQVVKDLDEFRAQMDETLTEAEIEDDNHPMVEEWGRRVEAAETLVNETKRGAQLNNGPFRLYQIKVLLAEAYESAREYKKAEAVYNEMLKEMFQLSDEDYLKLRPPISRMIQSGASRCYFHLNDFDRAKVLAQMSMGMNRHFPGIHILLAQAQWALNEQQEAIRTMCRGVLYETPWDESNQERNRVYLQEFIDARKNEN
jgi:tetratricopeptide (TPR) repeat protein